MIKNILKYEYRITDKNKFYFDHITKKKYLAVFKYEVEHKINFVENVFENYFINEN